MKKKKCIFTTRLKEMMEIRKITIEQLAEITGYSIDNIKRYRRNSYNKIPPLEVVRSFADSLNCDVAFLTGDTDFINLKSEQLSDITGISKYAAEILTELSDTEIDVLSKIIEHEDFPRLIDEIGIFSMCDIYDITVTDKLDENSPPPLAHYTQDYLKSIFEDPCTRNFKKIINSLYEEKSSLVKEIKKNNRITKIYNLTIDVIKSSSKTHSEKLGIIEKSYEQIKEIDKNSRILKISPTSFLEMVVNDTIEKM